MLRIDTLPSSALCRATLMYSRLRSSESSGKITRMMAPSLDGFTPRSLLRIAFSIVASDDLSNGCTTTIRGSGMWNDASWLTGVWVP
jgi:hypothetical protein